ncbi:MAG: hypothetical protein KDC54_09585 [Lewinella sp.]|nr:hypothetical protein [Lewinella sp.]
MKLNVPSKKKVPIPVSERLSGYLKHFNREVELPLQYEDLLNYESGIPLLDHQGNDSLWESVFYSQQDSAILFKALTRVYALLKTDGDMEVMEHLTISRIDYCTFGNTKPFRVRIINRLNDNYDHFYVKKADASRIYGLELEELLSPNSVVYLYDRHTVVEEHIAGVPGDDFMRDNLVDTTFNQIRMAKEFVKFNERCFVRLLGDMRAYNFVVDITPDIEGSQYRMRAIDFDQQSYEGWKSFYLPQYFKENNPVIFLGIKHLSNETVKQYQHEEHSLIAARVKSSLSRVKNLFKAMQADTISTPVKVAQLREELGYHHKTKVFDSCTSMGEIVLTNLQLLLQKDFQQSTIKLEVAAE